ncbi:MAG: carbohydrate kinase [Saprospiraceae bacterium]|nr:carbohydrate kinase [Saprospiraceae bacterium]
MTHTLQLPDFSDLHILVIGDVMIDRYLTGKVNRISPEAPVPVLEYKKKENRLGGAANVALNIKALGARVTVASISGNDEESDILNQLFSNHDISDVHLLKCDGRKTTVKTRIMAGAQHLLRIDAEDKHDISPDEENLFMDLIQKISLSDKVDGLILQDYNKGLLTKNLIEKLMYWSVKNQIPTFIDPKEKNFTAFKSCTVFKPNRKEISEALKSPAETQEQMAELDKQLRSLMSHSFSFITLSKDGIYISDGITSEIVPARPRIITDVCGAGDTVISVLSLCFLKGLSMKNIAIIANAAGGQVCEKPGVVPVDRTELMNELQSNY